MGTYAIPTARGIGKVALTMLITGSLSLQIAHAETPGLGKPVKEKNLSSLIVWPDGRGLPKGSGTAQHGREIYQLQCMSCHGVEGRGGINDVLAGGQVSQHEVPGVRTVGSYWPYATSLFDYVRRSMPYRTPGILTNDEVYSVVAYLLFLNELVDERQRLDARTLITIKLPNRVRFHSEYELP